MNGDGESLPHEGLTPQVASLAPACDADDHSAACDPSPRTRRSRFYPGRSETDRPPIPPRGTADNVPSESDNLTGTSTPASVVWP